MLDWIYGHKAGQVFVWNGDTASQPTLLSPADARKVADFLKEQAGLLEPPPTQAEPSFMLFERTVPKPEAKTEPTAPEVAEDTRPFAPLASLPRRSSSEPASPGPATPSPATGTTSAPASETASPTPSTAPSRISETPSPSTAGSSPTSSPISAETSSSSTLPMAATPSAEAATFRTPAGAGGATLSLSATPPPEPELPPGHHTLRSTGEIRPSKVTIPKYQGGDASVLPDYDHDRLIKQHGNRNRAIIHMVRELKLPRDKVATFWGIYPSSIANAMGEYKVGLKSLSKPEPKPVQKVERLTIGDTAVAKVTLAEKPLKATKGPEAAAMSQLFGGSVRVVGKR